MTKKEGKYLLEIKWTVSRAKLTQGFNICTLFVDGDKKAACNGGNYNMVGTSLGMWVEKEFKEELLKLTEPHSGLSFVDPTYYPGTEIIEGQTIEQREQEHKSFGLERYQAYHGATSKTPTEKHIIPKIDGGCGKEAVEAILTGIGYKLTYVKERNYTVEKAR